MVFDYVYCNLCWSIRNSGLSFTVNAIQIKNKKVKPFSFISLIFKLFQTVVYGLVTSVKVKQNPTNKFTQSEPRFFIRFISSRCSHYMYWRGLLTTIVEKQINKPAGTIKITMIVTSLIPYISFKYWLCLVVFLNKNCLVALL